MPVVEVNWLAVVVAALGAFVLGGLWYSPLLFADAWIEAHGFSDEELEEMKAGSGRAYVGSVALFVVVAVVLSAFVSYADVSGAVEGGWIGLLAWMGIAAPVGLTEVLFSGRESRAFAINAGYQLSYLLLMGAVIGAWR